MAWLVTFEWRDACDRLKRLERERREVFEQMIDPVTST